MSSDLPRLELLGECGFLLTWGSEVSIETNATVHRWVRHLQARLPSAVEIVPALASLAVFQDPARNDRPRLLSLLEQAIAHPPPDAEPAPAGKVHRIPVQYDGPDLQQVATATGLTPATVVKLHTAPIYTVMMVGFAPGFGYLGPLAPELVLPRRDSPRRRVVAGSVAIAGAQTAVYPLDTPGGWHLLGRTEEILFDPAGHPAARLRPGERVQFIPV